MRELDTTGLFENRHVQDWYYVRQLYHHTTKKRIPLVILWCLMSLACLGMLVIHFRTGSPLYGLFFLALMLFCLFQGLFMGQIRLRRSFNKTMASHGRRSWESVARFGETVEVQDGNGFSFQSEWRFCDRVEDQGAWLRLCFQGKLPKFYLRKADFTVGSAEDFLEWLSVEHPEVKQVKL